MTQQQILDALDNLMPEVVSTNNPEATLLKFAKTNNLYPTQLEKLGHAFNQCKTLVGLSKQANRGDSFSILNVPEMVTKYSTYKPSDVLTKEEKKIHKQVDKIVKSAGIKVASGGRLPMPDFMDRLVARGAEVIDNDVTEKVLVPSNSAFDVLFNKKASADVVVDEDDLLSEYEKYEKEKKDAEETEQFISDLEEVKAGLDEVIKTKCASVAQYLRKKGPQAWADIVEDSVLRFGVKSAAAIDTVENYLEVNHIPYNTANVDETIFTKYAFVEDRHNMFDLVSEVNDCLEEKCLADELILEKIATQKNPPLPLIPPAPPSLDVDFNQWSKQIVDAIQTGKQEGHNFFLVKDESQLGTTSPEVLNAYKTYTRLKPYMLDTRIIKNIVSSEQKRHAKNKKLIAEGKAILPPEFDQNDIDSYLTSTQKNYLKEQWDIYNESIKQQQAEKQEKEEKEKTEKEEKETQKTVDEAVKKYKQELETPIVDAFKSGFGLAKSTVTGVKDAVKGFNTGAKKTHQTVKDLINRLPEHDYNKKFLKADKELSKDFNLHKLILTDPVIAEADPQEVSEIYNTIAEISPRFAQNTRLMATALKEALQYGAVPLNMLKDISEFEKNMRNK